MNRLKLSIIKRVLMLDTEKELQKVEVNVLDAISRELASEDKEKEEFEKWKKEKEVAWVE